jgi:hypothetical protein
MMGQTIRRRQSSGQGVRLLFCVVVAAALLPGVGCSRNNRGNRPETFPVHGNVTMAGEPLAGATVMFNPVAVGGSGGIAVTDVNGHYRLTTFEAGDGAVPGDYQVALVKTIFHKQDGVDAMVAMSGDPKNVLPLRYADGSRSGFTAKVAAEPNNAFDFALEK